MQVAGRTWECSPTWSDIMGVGGFDPSAANKGAYASLVHGTASRPKPKPKTPSNPEAGGSPQPHPPQPPGCLHQCPGGNPHHPRHTRHRMLCAF